jgi:hypothetical protein
VAVESYRLNSIDSTSSNLRIMVGLLMNMKDLASGYSSPSLARSEQRTAAALRADRKCFEIKTFQKETRTKNSKMSRAKTE